MAIEIKFYDWVTTIMENESSKMIVPANKYVESVQTFL